MQIAGAFRNEVSREQTSLVHSLYGGRKKKKKKLITQFIV